MPEPEPQLQATANLSPVSPSPVHAAPSQVVPVLQDTVDTIDAMVAAAVAPNGMANFDTVNSSAIHMHGTDDDEVVDDDSFDDAYAEGDPAVEQAVEPQQEQLDSNDDYAKMFDSPIEQEEGDGDQDVPLQHVSSLPRESNHVTITSNHLTSRPSDASHAVVDPSLAAQSAAGLNVAAPGSEPATQSAAPAAAEPSNTHHPGSRTASSEPTVHSAVGFANTQDPSADIQKLVADLTSQSHEPSPAAPSDPAASTPSLSEDPAGSNLLPSSALASSSTLPPRPPLPHSASQSFASQQHSSGSSGSAPTSAAPPAPGQPSTYVIAGVSGTTPEIFDGLQPPLGPSLNASSAVTSLNAPAHPSAAPGVPLDQTHAQSQDSKFQHEWDQFMTDERQYMSEAKWDRFPEGSRIFIGNLSSDKVSKRDVFDLFHQFGRLAQISLKSAYGFVQYHTVDEGHRALENLQGHEVKGRRIRKYLHPL
jgi:nuclear polyadenylated RNA-binding protein 3